jgi:NAD(P)H-hydrate epimerase
MMDRPVDSPELPVFPVASLRAIDRAAIDTGIPGYELMTRAARYAFDVARGRFPDAARWQVLCGSGNNGGDGYVLAGLAAAAGIDVEVLWLSDPAKLSGDAATGYRDFVAAGGSVRAFGEGLDPRADLLVDAMLGSGLSRDVAGPFLDAVAACNDHPAPVLALDVPTGLHGDSGAVMGSAIVADVTISFVGRKPGLYLGAGPDRVGQLYFSDLQIPAACYAAVPASFRIVTAAQVRRQLPRRPRQSHKGDFGHVLVIGGAPGMPGAVCLAGEAALRAGAGRVSVATHAANAAVVPARRPELMCHAVDGAAALEPLLRSASVIAIGPGLGRGDWSAALLEAALASGVPLVADADALNLLAGHPAPRDDRILTPHPGEAARLLGQSSAEVQADRRLAVCELQRRYGGTVVLKGRGTLVASEAGLPWLCSRGNPGMASAGMGDVLTGIIAGLLAQGLSLEMAAVIGVDVHARAADVAAECGERGLLATELLQELRPWLNP